MISSASHDDDDYDHHELDEEFQKLALLVPTIPKDERLTELEFLEFVIAYIQQLQELLAHDHWSECLTHLTSSMKNSFLSSSHNVKLLFPNDTCPPRNPLSTINLDTNVPQQ